MIDRNCDATILSGASDRRLATRVLQYARSTRERLGIRPGDFDIGSMLHHDIPFLAHVAGGQMSSEERSENPHVHGGYSRERSIAEASRHVMRSTVFSSGMPGNCLLSDPAKGNAAAILVDRVADLADVPRLKGGVPCDPLAAHMFAQGMNHGRDAFVRWTPGWPDATPEGDVAAYVRRAYALDDRQLAAETVEHCRELRSRMGIPDGDMPLQTTLWQTVPALGVLFGMAKNGQEGDRFTRSVREIDDQSAFGIASRMVDAAVRSGMPERSDLTIGERSLFSPVASGNSLVVLLDRAGRALDVERGGEDDPIGRQVAEARGDMRSSQSAIWRPEEHLRRPASQMLIASLYTGMGR